ncbi:hypothetical protein BaRGS_00019888 [Batillaria attramentaria]|uniref:Ig-like domain-containing protein n=1 Tax=Batillaria attramentaria TaxID=370345 RepID=A0ABD0KPS0_9CAEN
MLLLQSNSLHLIAGDAGESIISMKPSSGSLVLESTATGGQVEITCVFPPNRKQIPKFATDISLNMKRVVQGSTDEQKLTAVLIGNETAIDLSGDNVLGSSASGALKQELVKFTMPQTTCHDAGVYICEAAFLIGFALSKTMSNKTLSVSVNPGQATMGATPKLTVYSYNTFLSLTCSGDVGTVDDTTKVQWIWEYKESQGTSWYQVHDEEVTLKSSTPSGPGDCARYQVSKFDRALITEDTGKTFRCFVRRNGSTIQDFHQYAGTYTINTVLKPGKVLLNNRLAASTKFASMVDRLVSSLV